MLQGSIGASVTSWCLWLCLPAQKGQQDMQFPQWFPAAETLGWCSCREQGLSLGFGAPRLAL